ncbi:hypothetical protein P175DRAFT_0497399 [Aspergillus ochraceoroseus IBT 24754]|uniref:ferroxidase n=2 Tax=Aspergillus ochraceoroseus TaxID=138278 RepID=A0A2T5M6X2_9EURO|nr:uncharacterized protein P175DRAFT_0497399 [Aspergillus ochraceoroseus IBT 24754]KKK14724.1 hypothetical protein AOCH_001711 [Aspergillus ochraceoroseus]PTU24287.1 hypothetical protein P175DRAFT_0497399 [Aspergillus ochraceoroseus IBT 24754]
MLSRRASQALHHVARIRAPPRAASRLQSNTSPRFFFFSSPSTRQGFHSTAGIQKGIFPNSSDPPAPNPQSTTTHASEPSPLTDQQFHEHSEHYLNVLQTEIENVQEEGSDMEAEYSAGVLNISVPAVGTYVLNKQPPNKQIWLSSPISGPKRYDWVIEGDHMHEKQDTRPFVNGQWICLRDGSNLTDLLNGELGLSLPEDVYSEVDE